MFEVDHVKRNKRRTGYVYENLISDSKQIHFPELPSFVVSCMMANEKISAKCSSQWFKPYEFRENSKTKETFHNLITKSGLINELIIIAARDATKEEITLNHSEGYYEKIRKCSINPLIHCDEYENCARFQIASRSVGGVLEVVNAILFGEIDNAYCLIQSPGHEACFDRKIGFCVFNNAAIATHFARKQSKGLINKIAIIDIDIIHGRGMQEAFWNDPNCLTISLHQATLDKEERIEEIGGKDAQGCNVNIPLNECSDYSVYEYALQNIVCPITKRFQPQLIFVCCGFGASFADPSGFF
jgi:acetoin utilization deacetylase AcuC-like enzyme